MSDTSFYDAMQHQEAMNALVIRTEYTLFSMIKPTIKQDGDHWCCLYGKDLQEGIAGFGKSPHLAVMDWNKEWYKQLTATDNG